MDALLEAERVAAGEWLGRMAEADRQNVDLVQRCIAETMEEFLSDPQQHDRSVYRRGELIGPERIGYPFFSLYLIGGAITKVGERPDIDLLAVTNMRYMESPFKRWDDPKWVTEDEPLMRKLQLATHGYMGMRIEGELPDNYNLGVTGGKTRIRLSPKQGKPVDLVYVKSMRHHNPPDEACRTATEEDQRERHFFLTEGEFLAKDVDTAGAALPGVVLYRANGAPPEPLRWRA